MTIASMRRAATLLCSTIGAIAVLVALAAGLAACEDEHKPKNPIVVPDDAPNDETWGTTIVFTDSTQLKARLKVRHARRYLARQETLLDSGVYIEFFAPDGSLNAFLLADSARIDDRTKDMVAYGYVHVESARSKTTVDTDRLHWSNDKRLLHSDAHVHVVDRMRGREIQGTGYESDEGLRNYKIYNVSGSTLPQR